MYLERERQRSLEQIEDEQEEEEVEFAVSPERDLGPFELHGDNDEEEDEIGKDLIAVTRDDGEEGVEVGGNELDDEASEDEDEDEEEDEDEKRREEKTSMTPSSVSCLSMPFPKFLCFNCSSTPVVHIRNL